MRQVLVLLVAAVAVVGARPEPQGLDVEPGSAQPYDYHYEVNVPETGDQKSHTEQRDEAGVVVGNFQVVDPNGDLRKLFYRVEGNSGFVITDQQVMVGFAPPPPDPATYSSRRTTEADSQGGLGGGRTDAGSGGTSQALESDQSGAAGAGQGLFGGQFSDGGSSQLGGGSDGFQAGFADGDVEILVSSDEFSSSNDGFSSSNGGASFIDDGSSSFSDSNSVSEGNSLEGGSSAAGSSAGTSFSSDGADGGLSGTSTSSGTIGPINSQATKPAEVKPFEFHGPAFTFSIQRTEPNRFEVKERIIGHAVEFNTHGGRARRSPLGQP